MSSKKILRIDIKQEDLTTITNLRNLLTNFLNTNQKSEVAAKKAAHVLNNWLQKDKLKK